MKRRADAAIDSEKSSKLMSNWISNPGTGEKDSGISTKRSLLSMDSGISQKASCPVCGVTMLASSINSHLDLSCLAKQATRKDAPSQIINDASLVVRNLRPYELSATSLPGLWVINDFITEAEERDLIEKLDASGPGCVPWFHSSFNGHCLSKTFGVVTQFGPSRIQERIVRKNDPVRGERDIPDYLLPFISRMRSLVKYSSEANMCKFPAVLNTFHPNECNINCYIKSDGHFLTPHYDDRFLSGPVLMNLSLCGRSRMTFTRGESEAAHDTVVVNLPRRCLQLVMGPARFSFKHRINADDLLDPKRISITWRHAGSSNGGLIRGMQANEPSIESFLGQQRSSRNDSQSSSTQS